MIQSEIVSPSPRPLTGSLLLTLEIAQSGLESQLSMAVAETLTRTILWFGGQRASGLALTFWMTGGVVSATSMVCAQLLSLPQESVAVQVREIVLSCGHLPGVSESECPNNGLSSQLSTAIAVPVLEESVG